MNKLCVLEELSILSALLFADGFNDRLKGVCQTAYISGDTLTHK